MFRSGHPHAKTYGHNAAHPHGLSCSVHCEPERARARGPTSRPIRKARSVYDTRDHEHRHPPSCHPGSCALADV